LPERPAVVAAFGPHDPQGGERVEQPDEQDLRPGLVAGGSGRDDKREQPAFGVDGEVPAAAGDVLGAVVAVGLLADGAVLDHVRDRVAHRTQTVDRRPTDGELVQQV